MIEYVTRNAIELRDFPAWGGASIKLEELCNHEAAYELIENYVEEWSQMSMEGEEPLEDGAINDFLWFYMDDELIENGLMDADGNWVEE